MKPLLCVLSWLLACNGSASAQTYSTAFALTENPISENRRWINGKDAGLDWANVATTPALAIGLQSGAGGYDDATALLAGSWGPDQSVEATVHTENQNEALYEEVEIRLRSTLASHINAGYEVNFRCLKTDRAYVQIVRWNGLVGDFTYLADKSGAQYGVTNGDVIKATIIGPVITAYINGFEVARVADNTYATGRPGMGFFLSQPMATKGNYGLTSFIASGSSSAAMSSPAGSENPGDNSCCFIATAAYRSPFAPEVARLRAIRSRYLLRSAAGRKLARFYDQLSHPLAVRVAHSQRLQMLTRVALMPEQAWARLFLWSPFLGVLVVGGTFTVAGVTFVVVRRRRRNG